MWIEYRFGYFHNHPLLVGKTNKSNVIIIVIYYFIKKTNTLKCTGHYTVYKAKFLKDIVSTQMTVSSSLSLSTESLCSVATSAYISSSRQDVSMVATLVSGSVVSGSVSLSSYICSSHV